MNYKSTRYAGKAETGSAEAIRKGLASDGGLFVTEKIEGFIQGDVPLSDMDYPERVKTVLGQILGDYSLDELYSYAEAAYNSNSFPGGAAPVREVRNGLYALELWHGPTAAFKDMALQIMPRLLSGALGKTGEKRTVLILVATSGDTGKAALEGFKDIPGIKIMVFYPEDGVSVVQKLQMQTQTGDNVKVMAVKGNFDDAQSAVKRIFSNADTAAFLNENGCFLSSANSINWGRLAPQIVYYCSVCGDLIKENRIKTGDKVNICVPTGNFGNIFAAYYAKKMGFPIGRIICASNSNNVLTDFIRTGVYDRNRDFHLTVSPSMDILISSNLERLLYCIAGPEETSRYMDDLKKYGKYTVSDSVLKEIQKDFSAYYTNEEDTLKTIKKYWNECAYLCDTHTSVAMYAAEQYRMETTDNTPLVVVSTASPYKFASDVYYALTGKRSSSGLEAIDALADETGTEIPYPLKDIGSRKIRFTQSISVDEMDDAVRAFALE